MDGIQGLSGARAFVDEGWKDGDVVMLWPGTYTACTWGLDAISTRSSPSASIELIGIGRRGAIRS